MSFLLLGSLCLLASWTFFSNIYCKTVAFKEGYLPSLTWADASSKLALAKRHILGALFYHILEFLKTLNMLKSATQLNWMHHFSLLNMFFTDQSNLSSSAALIAGLSRSVK